MLNFGSKRSRANCDTKEQPPTKQSKNKVDDKLPETHSIENLNPFDALPNEVLVNILSFFDLETLNTFAQTNHAHHGLITQGEDSSELKHNTSFFRQPLTWSEMSNLFREKVGAQWEEVQQAIEGGILSQNELSLTQPANNIKEFNKIESILNEVNADIIRRALDGNFIDRDTILKRRFNIRENYCLLDLSYLSLTRLPLKQLFEEEKYKNQFYSTTWLFLNANKLCAPLPSELFQLTQLSKLRISGSKIKGPILLELTKLINLEEISIYGTQFSGPIPSELKKLVKLKNLTLVNNKFSGSIPKDLAQLKNLRTIELNHNQFTGPLPSELAQLINLRILWLANNMLTGTIPPELNELRVLKVSFENNQLSGPVPTRLAQRFPNLIDSEGYIKNQYIQVDNQENSIKCHLKP